MLLIAVLSVSAVTPLHAEGVVDPTPELYRVSTLRAAPGALLDVLALYADAAAAGHWQGLDEAEPMLIRHAQGDQWDLLVLQPIGSYAEYYARKRVAQRAAAGEAAFRLALTQLVAFRQVLDRKSVVEGKSVSGRVDIGGRRIIKKKNQSRYIKTCNRQFNTSNMLAPGNNGYDKSSL